MDTTIKTDAELVRAVLRGDKNAFPVLLERHMDSVYKFAFRYVRNGEDADDVTQEAFIRVWKNLKKFDTSKNFKTWLFTIAKNVALDILKKKKPLNFSQIAEEDEQLDAVFASHLESPELPDSLYERKLVKAGLGAALTTLPQNYQTVLTMRYEGNLKFREIAETLHEPIDTVKSKHRRGLMMLRKVVGKDKA
ncbi:MAG TPA: sigma-70 family RNA polymerase sigma factor [Candidatus Paceibacterota bacterium]|jgi:RNA polymerase sigma-70 factor (ECF subfamily)|nr:sigma-70 family RNA polymerase sigma factor [Candidatus Paceibacterota bacterium]